MVLCGNETSGTGRACGPLGVRDLPGREVRRPHVADLAFADDLVKCGQRLLDRSERVGRVKLEKIDIVGLKPAERTFHSLADVSAGSARVEVGPVCAAHVVAEFGGEDHVVASGPQDMAEQCFGAALVAVGVGCVEERDAVVERRGDDSPGALEVDS